MVKVKLTKIAERADAECPNNIPINDYRIGYVPDIFFKPIVGIRYGLKYVIEINGRAVPFSHWFITSFVVEIIDDTTFKTINSIYKIEYLEYDCNPPTAIAN